MKIYPLRKYHLEDENICLVNENHPRPAALFDFFYLETISGGGEGTARQIRGKGVDGGGGGVRHSKQSIIFCTVLQNSIKIAADEMFERN